MSKSRDLMKTLADARPAQLDPPGTPPLPFALTDAPVPGRRTRRFRAAALIPAGGLTAAAVAVAVVAAGSGGIAPAGTAPGGTGPNGTVPNGTAPGGTGAVGAPADARPSATAQRPPTASRILLAAAERSSRDTPGAGRYLVVRVESGSVLTVGSGSSAYRMTARSSYQTWLSRSGREPNRLVSQQLGLTPATPADEAAWRAAGSPGQVLVGKPLPSGEVGPGSPVPVAGGPREISAVDEENYALGTTDVTVRDLERLPADPAALRGALLAHFDGGGGDLPTDRDEWLLSVAAGLITEIPVSGPVRAAAFRLMAGLDGVRTLGVVADRRGRPGEGFAFTTGSVERRFVIDARTGRALGEETRVARPAGVTARLERGSLLGYSVVLEQRTTDEQPPR